ncbi:MAG: DUF4968 domain-containing protein [Chloroflexi bacterium]|nr:DUF4968 domain-containing protein [Chloroflexota bacterium]
MKKAPILRKPDPLAVYTDIGGNRLVAAVKAAEKVAEVYARRYEATAAATPTTQPWHTVGAVQSVMVDEQGVRCACEAGWVELHWQAADCLRVRWQPNGPDFIPFESPAVVAQNWPEVPFEVFDGDSSFELRTHMLKCLINKDPLRLRLEFHDGRTVCSDARGIQLNSDGGARLSLAMRRNEGGFGLGMRAFPLNLRGHRLQLWNTDPGAYQPGTDPLHYSIPFYLGVNDGLVYGVFWANYARGSVDVGAGTANELVFESDTGELCYYLFAGVDVTQVIGRYTELTGRAELPPLWALGYQHQRLVYESPQAILELAAEFRQRAIACDVLYLDVCRVCDLSGLSAESQDALRALVAELHSMGYRVIATVTPGVTVDETSGIPAEWFLSYPDGQPVVGATWTGLCRFPDFANPEARTWWSERLLRLLDTGIDGIHLDLAEPTLLTASGQPASLPPYVQHQHNGEVYSDHAQLHNLYGMLAAAAVDHALHHQRAGQRQFVMGRSGFAGAQRFMATDTGANTSSWAHLRLSISMALNLALSGEILVGAEVGGFHGDADGELLTRWLQAAALMPLMRNATFAGTQPQEPWAFGQPHELIGRLAIALRYRLMPYLYSAIAFSREYGYPVIRPLFMMEPDNPHLRTIDDEYMLGNALLVAPVLEPGAIHRSVYLPKGLWYDFWTNEPVWGGQALMVTAPLERLPLFVRAGAAVPMWPDDHTTSQSPSDKLILRVYPGAGESVIYEDDGDGPTLEQGDYRWVYITCGWNEERHFVVKRRTAGRYAPPYARINVEIVGINREPLEVRLDLHGAPLWYYDHDVIELTAGDNFQRIEVKPKPSPMDTTLMHRRR